MRTKHSTETPYLRTYWRGIQRAYRISIVATVFTLSVSVLAYAKPSLRGSAASLDRQNRAANNSGLKRHKTSREVMKTVNKGRLIRVKNGVHYELYNVSYPYAHPSLKAFLGRFAKRYHRLCGAPLVITSLTRPINTQPKNASSRSVHPTGIAADLRLPWRSCRMKIEPILLQLEADGVIEATRERRPPHYHITINPSGFKRELERNSGSLRALSEKRRSRSSKPKVARNHRIKNQRSSHRKRTYFVKSGDNLWDLSQRWKVSVRAIKRLNNIRSNMLQPGQRILIP